MIEPMSNLNIIIATFIVSLFSLIGISALSLNEKTLHRILFVLVAFSAGSILGAAYFDLLPEAIELVEESNVLSTLPLDSSCSSSLNDSSTGTMGILTKPIYARKLPIRLLLRDLLI